NRAVGPWGPRIISEHKSLLNHRFEFIQPMLAALLLGNLLVLAAAAAPPADAEKELQAVRDRIEELQRSMRRDTDRRDALSGQLRDAEENVRGAREKLGDVRK